MEIITGYTGKPHVTAEQDRDVNEGIFDTGSFVLKTGSQLAAELVSNNEIKIRDGVLVIQGCTAVIKKNTYDPVTIANGSQGMKRIDLIVARYNKNEETKIEEVTLKVIQGTPNASTAAVPTYKTGDIQSGDLVADMPLYKITLNGLNVTSVDKMFTVIPTLPELNSKLAKSNDSIAAINNKLISIVERGEKNGYNYIKYSNGDAVVWRKYTWNTDVSVSWYGLYFASSKAVDFPFAFKEAPLIIVSPGTTNELYWMGVNEVSTTGYKLTAYSVKKGMCYSQGNMLIIGKWK